MLMQQQLLNCKYEIWNTFSFSLKTCNYWNFMKMSQKFYQ